MKPGNCDCCGNDAIATWEVDGTDDIVCLGCILAALRCDADFDEFIRRLRAER